MTMKATYLGETCLIPPNSFIVGALPHNRGLVYDFGHTVAAIIGRSKGRHTLDNSVGNTWEFACEAKSTKIDYLRERHYALKVVL